MENLSLYIHIPFCVKKCHYCDFLSAPGNEETRQNYVEALCREIMQKAVLFKKKAVDTIFFGGGTPSILSAEQITKIMSVIRTEFRVLANAEISIEMNPGTVNREKLETYKELGINRLSIGLQSADDEDLKILGRIHTWEVFLDTWKMVRETGFSNVNIDLMSALPGQTLESYEETLRKVLALKPEHISAYSLIVEEGTLFYEWFVKDGESRAENESEQAKALPDENKDRQMYELTKKILEEQGYYRYEISNYALKGHECRHNIGYWKRKEYLGLGLGAASLIFEDSQNNDVYENNQILKDTCGSFKKNIRCSNITDLENYLRTEQDKSNENLDNSLKEQEHKGGKPLIDKRKTEGLSEEFLNKSGWIDEVTKLSVTDQMEEFMFLGLRMMEGISPTEFEKQFGTSLQEVYGKQILKLEKSGLLLFDERTGRYALTSRGIDISNQVFTEFID